jgi:hypothetical protein
MPFFETDFKHSWRQRWLRALAAHYKVLGVIASILACLPVWLQEAVIHMFACE